MSTFTGTTDQLGDVIERGLRHDLKTLIKEKLCASVDQLLEDMAVEIASNIVIRAESEQAPDQGYGSETRVIVQFNLKDPSMIYDTKTKEMKRREVLNQ